MKIIKLLAREVLDSRGCPTVRCSVLLSDGSWHSAVAPSGRSKGGREPVELRDFDGARFSGKGVLGAVQCIEEKVAPLIIGREPNFVITDALLLEGDGTKDKSHYGANTMIAVSCAVARAQAYCNQVPLYRFIAQELNIAPSMPCCMFNLINGGAHAGSLSLIQEIMCVGQQGESLDKVLSDIVLFSSMLEDFLMRRQGAVGLGDEGGFVVLRSQLSLELELETLGDLSCLQEKVFRRNDRFHYALDVAASQFYDVSRSCYVVNGNVVTSEELAVSYSEAVARWPLVAIEDPFDEGDGAAWASFVRLIDGRCLVVGDDLFVTNEKLIRQGAQRVTASAVVIKPNQAGTLTESLAAVRAAREVGYAIVASHRSGETCDDFIADFAVGIGADFAKFGACARSERVSKYNRLLRIEEEILNKE